MANVQIENGYIKIANQLYDELLKRDLSKRQLNIIMFIMRYSYGFKRKACQFENISDFEQAGISKTHIREELTRLDQSKIIFWDKVLNIFQLNKNYDEWVLSNHSFYRKEKTEKLLKQELTRSQNSNQVVTKIVTDGLPKQELSGAGNPQLKSDSDPPKDNKDIKDNITLSYKGENFFKIKLSKNEVGSLLGIYTTRLINNKEAEQRLLKILIEYDGWKCRPENNSITQDFPVLRKWIINSFNKQNTDKSNKSKEIPNGQSNQRGGSILKHCQ